MYRIFSNVNDAFRGIVTGIYRKEIETIETESRNGPVLSVPRPVCVTYTSPRKRVLFSPTRDANPFFHLFEAMWMLAGRNDIEPLRLYNSRIGDFSDDGKVLNGAYGYRWRYAAPHEELVDTAIGDLSAHTTVDQLDLLASHLQSQPNSRRAVLQMWNVEDDLLKIDGEDYSKDVCCNLGCVFKVISDPREPDRLDMTVFNRSNDLFWGMLGANYVHFSFLLEYMAAKTGVPIGHYHQITTDLHVYTETNSGWNPREYMKEWELRSNHSPPKLDYGTPEAVTPSIDLVEDPTRFDWEVRHLIDDSDLYANTYGEPFLKLVVRPYLRAFKLHKERRYFEARSLLAEVMPYAPDWAIAGIGWLDRREHAWYKRRENIAEGAD